MVLQMNNWQCYHKVNSRWEMVASPMSKTDAEAWVASKWHILHLHEARVKDLKKRNIKRMPPDPGFREPHCVPV